MINAGVLTISDKGSKGDREDISGEVLREGVARLQGRTVEYECVPDEKDIIAAKLAAWADSGRVDIILTTGGTGVTGRDGTPEAVEPLLDKVLDGFGETFRILSFKDIKTSTIQSRAIAGVANATYIFCLPGSSGACRTAWDLLIKDQLDLRTRPCNLVQLMPRLLEK